jgi:hypothetical protein
MSFEIVGVIRYVFHVLQLNMITFLPKKTCATLAILKRMINKYPGEVTPCQIKNHVQRKFVTPILYAIDIFKNYDFFSLHT